MGIDPHGVGLLAAQFMERLEERHGEDATITSLAFIAAVDRGDRTTVEFAFRDGEGGPLARHVGLGLLAEVERGIYDG